MHPNMKLPLAVPNSADSSPRLPQTISLKEVQTMPPIVLKISLKIELNILLKSERINVISVPKQLPPPMPTMPVAQHGNMVHGNTGKPTAIHGKAPNTPVKEATHDKLVIIAYFSFLSLRCRSIK
jgi:hypothetical protein